MKIPFDLNTQTFFKNLYSGMMFAIALLIGKDGGTTKWFLRL